MRGFAKLRTFALVAIVSVLCLTNGCARGTPWTTTTTARNCEAMKMFRWINAAGVMTGRVGAIDDDDERRRAMTMKNDRVVAINRVCDT